MPESYWIQPDWPVPTRVQALATTRLGGCSPAPFSSFNLAYHVDDDPSAVKSNRQLLQERVGLTNELFWVSQVHGTEVRVLARDADPGKVLEADAIYTRNPRQACAIMTADCLPVLLAAADGSEVGVVHAGWRGLAAGVIENALACFQTSPSRIMAWLGPAIGPFHFEVGDEVRQAFMQHVVSAADVKEAFQPGVNKGKWQADLYRIAQARLRVAGVSGIYGGGYCTFQDEQRFYSFRRDYRTGRMASVIWLTDQ